MTKTRNKPPEKLSRADFPSHFFNRWLPETRPMVVRNCEYPGCGGAGDHRAPLRRYHDERQRTPLNIIEEHGTEASRWFCLDHVKQYNANWDYYEGLDEREMEDAIRFDAVWNRPSWPIGQWGKGAPKPEKRKAKPKPEEEEEMPLGEDLRDALSVLNLSPPVPFAEVKKRYRELVKRHHPDVVGSEAEGANDMITKLNSAFTLLKNFYMGRKG
jgi:DnaJ-domain-containing protein 1